MSRIGDVLHRGENVSQAARYFERALELNRILQYVHGQAWCLEKLAKLDSSDPDRARARYEEALALHRQGGTILGEANCLYDIGVIAAAQRQANAATFLKSARELYHVVPDPVSVGRCHMQLGRLAPTKAEAQHHFGLAREAFVDNQHLLAKLSKCEAELGEA